MAPGETLRPYLLADVLRGAATAAGLLENACASGPGGPLRLEIVRGLARDLMVELGVLAGEVSERTDATPTAVLDFEGVEGALRAADVANLAACAAPHLEGAHAAEAVAAARLAAGTALALRALVDAGTAARGDSEPYPLRDVRGAAWRARFAARQVDEFSGEAG